MANATGVAKQLRIKKESVFKTAPGTSGGILLRRVSSDLVVGREAYENNEIRSDYQRSNPRLGSRTVRGNINGLLSPSTYSLLFAALLRKDFAAGVSLSGLTITASASGKTMTRSAGSWLTDGVKVGDVVRFGGFTSTPAANNGKNFRVMTLTATVMGVDKAPTDASNAASITCAVTGKKTFIPVTGHTNDSFAIEHWFSDVNQSELFLGCRPISAQIGLPSTGNASVGFGILGAGVQNATAQYYVNPTAETTTEVLQAVTGALRLGTTDSAIVTGASINITGAQEPGMVIGANDLTDVFPGSVVVKGQFTTFFANTAMRDAFLNETGVSLGLALYSDGTDTADFMTFNMEGIRLTSFGRSDGQGGLIETLNFDAGIFGAGGTGTAYEKSSITIQDSLA